MSVIYECSKEVRALVPDKPFQPIVMYVAKSYSLLLKGAPKSWVGSGLTRKH